ncbi:MAG: zinc-dependent metalloprotease family protein [Chitinophagales bacterium]
MKKILTILILLSITLRSYASVDSCGVEDADSVTMTTFPWFGNNAFLTNLVDSIKNANTCTNCRTTNDGIGNFVYQIPVRVILYYDASHRALNDDEVQWYINAVNQIYKQNGFKVQLYLDKCGPFRKNSSLYAYASNWAQMLSTALNVERENNKLNVTLIHGWNLGNGIGPYPWMQDKYGCAIIANGTSPFADLSNAQIVASSIAHEIGHTIGLLHTFNRNNPNRANCFQECVSRTRTQEGYCAFTQGSLKCEVNGDCLCDTHADIMNLSSGPNGYDGAFANCNNLTYDVSASNTLSNNRKYDNYGDQWYKPGTWYGVPFANAMQNLMSYWGCNYNQITKMQQGVMYHYIGKTNSSMKYNDDVDFYENDNFHQPNVFSSITTFNPESYCNLASINSKQYHTFHHSAGTACDVDWVYFQPFQWDITKPVPTSKPYIIQTQEVTGKPKPDTKITLYAVLLDNSLVQLSQHDNNSVTDLFSKITQTLPYSYNISGVGTVYVNNYAIKIENNITNTSDTRSKGHYYLRVDECFDKTGVNIVGDATICISKPYSVSGALPVGATVAWSVIPAGAVTFVNTGNNTVATKATNGNATIKATITACGVTYELTKPVGLGVPFTLYNAGGCNFQEAVMETAQDDGPCNTQCYSPGGPNITWCLPVAYNASNISVQKVLSFPLNYNYWSATGNEISLFFKAASQSVEFKRTLTNVCGSIDQYYCFGSTTTQCPSQMMMMTATSNQTVKAYPNPTAIGSTITIELFLEEQPIDFENATIQLVDKSNKVVLEKVGKKVLKEKLDIQSVSSGTYYVTVTNANGVVSTELIINNGQ